MDMAMHGKTRGRANFETSAVRNMFCRVWPCSSVVFCFLTVGLLAGDSVSPTDARHGIYNPLHEYDTRPVEDRFTRFLAAWDAGQKPDIDLSGDLPFLHSLL